MAESRGPRAGEALDAVRWEYDPEDEVLSPLVSTRRYFQDFPWEPEEVFAAAPAAAGEAAGED